MTTLYLSGKTAQVIKRNMWRFGLTQREREVCWHYIHGRSRKEIATLLDCAEQTVKVHLAAIRRRCGHDTMIGEPSASHIRLLRLFAGVPPVVYTSTLGGDDGDTADTTAA